MRAPRSGARAGRFNCCEFCAAPLTRHPESAWRYDGICARCGRSQSWAPLAAFAHPSDDREALLAPATYAGRHRSLDGEVLGLSTVGQGRRHRSAYVGRHRAAAT
jgi:hypothetical protein